MSMHDDSSESRLPVLRVVKAEFIHDARGETGVDRTTRLARALVEGFAIPRNVSLGSRLTHLPAGDALTAVRQWLTQADPTLLLREPDAARWEHLVAAFAIALRNLRAA